MLFRSKEIQENTGKQVEALKEETNKSLKEIHESTIRKVKELNKAVQDLKVEVETIKKTQMETNLEMENLRKRSGITDLSITNRIQAIDSRIPGVEDMVEEIDTTVKENSKHKNLLTQNIQEIQGTMNRPNLRITGIEENGDSQQKGPENVFNEITEENFPYLKKGIAIKVQEVDRKSVV